MPADVFLRPQAKRDIVEQALYIAEHNPEAADRFLEAVEHAFALLEGFE
jgi:plasmid stabilization system protein ParE